MLMNKVSVCRMSPSSRTSLSGQRYDLAERNVASRGEILDPETVEPRQRCEDGENPSARAQGAGYPLRLASAESGGAHRGGGRRALFRAGLQPCYIPPSISQVPPGRYEPPF